MLSGPAWVIAIAVVAAGSIVQGSIGFGLALLAAPLLLLIEPTLVPGPILVVSGALTLLMSRREWSDVRSQDLGWALGGRVVGILASLGVLRVLSARELEPVLALIVLAAVAMTARGWKVPLTTRTLMGAGALSGFMGTATSIGGPPMALLYQHEPGPRLRATLSLYFVFGVILSIAGLVAIGRFGTQELILGAQLLPGVLIAFPLSGRMARWVDGGRLRHAVLVVSALAALLVLLKQLSR